MIAWQKPLCMYDTTALHELKERGSFPAIAILFNDSEREVDGRRMLRVIEEAHIALKHPVMEPWLIQRLRTDRKRHVGMVFVLTDLEGIAEPTLRALKTLCGTVFATMNPNVEATRDRYRFLGFEERHIDALAARRDGPSKDRFVYWQLGADGVAPFTLDLTPLEVEVYAKGNGADRAVTARALADSGDDAPAAILEAKGFAGAAEAWCVENERGQRAREVGGYS